MKLYELTQALLNAIYRADDEAFDPDTGEYTEPTEATKVALDTLDMAFDDKIEGIAKVVRNLEAERDAAKKESDRLAQRARGFDSQIKWLKRYAAEAMDAVDHDKKIKTGLFTIWVQPASQAPLIIDEGVEVPEEFLKPPAPRAPDRAALKAAIEKGREIAGIRIGAVSRSLRIR